MNESLHRTARRLAWFTVLYNLAEAVACGLFGGREHSLSLLGFGGDSLIESASGAVVLWSFREGAHERKDATAHKLISVLLIALAMFLGLSAWFSLKSGAGPQSGLPGLVISSVSLLTMFFLYRQKLKIAKALDSAALRADAFCTLSCMWLSGLLLLGSALFMGFNKSWFDAATTLGMAVLIAREGFEEYDEAAEALGDEHD